MGGAHKHIGEIRNAYKISVTKPDYQIEFQFFKGSTPCIYYNKMYTGLHVMLSQQTLTVNILLVNFNES